MSPYQFLSPEWIAAVSAIRDEYSDHGSIPDLPVKANVTITDAPFSEGTIDGHIDTSTGTISIEIGHLDDNDFAIEVPYAIAYQIFVKRDPQELLGILIGGQVKLTGDSSKILGLAGIASQPNPNSEVGAIVLEVIGRIDAVTAKLTD